MPTGEEIYYAGIEGGGSSSKMVILNEKGEIIVHFEGSGSNFFLLGIDEAVKRVRTVIDATLDKLGKNHVKLACLGLALSGAEDEHMNNRFLDHLKLAMPNISFYLTSDSIGSIVTALKTGGIVLIAGTGSSCRLLNPSGELHCCGGWGHMIGDQGGAFWIALNAVKLVFNVEDGLEDWPFDVSYVKTRMIEFFKLKSRLGIFDHLYNKFDKSKFAEFCKEIAVGAREHNDQLCCHVFEEAGRYLGRHVLAVSRFVDNTLIEEHKGLPVVTVGSVWNSFDLLKDGFLEALKPISESANPIKDIKLYRLKVSTGVGAAFLAAKEIGANLPLDFSSNSELYFEHKF